MSTIAATLVILVYVNSVGVSQVAIHFDNVKACIKAKAALDSKERANEETRCITETGEVIDYE